MPRGFLPSPRSEGRRVGDEGKSLRSRGSFMARISHTSPSYDSTCRCSLQLTLTHRSRRLFPQILPPRYPVPVEAGRQLTVADLKEGWFLPGADLSGVGTARVERAAGRHRQQIGW